MRARARPRSAPSSIGLNVLVTITGRFPLLAIHLPIQVSLRPPPYASAVSNVRMPSDHAPSISANACSSFSPWPKKAGAEPTPPKFPQPSARREISTPLAPSCRFSIGRFSPSGATRGASAAPRASSPTRRRRSPSSPSLRRAGRASARSASRAPRGGSRRARHLSARRDPAPPPGALPVARLRAPWRSPSRARRALRRRNAGAGRRARRRPARPDRSRVGESQRAQFERRRELRGRLAHVQPRSLLDLLERELDGALVVPVEHEPLARRRLDDRRTPLVAVGPAKDALAPPARVELDVVREPLLELLGVRQCLPHLVRRDGEDDLSAHFHDSSNPQPLGCVYTGATDRLHFTRRLPCP